MTRRPEPGRPGDAWPYLPVIDDFVVDVLQGLDPWRSVGDSLDWDIAMFAYDVPADVSVMGVPVPLACTRGR